MSDLSREEVLEVQLLAAGMLSGRQRPDLSLLLLEEAESVLGIVEDLVNPAEGATTPGILDGFELDTAESLGLTAADLVFTPSVAPDPADVDMIFEAIEESMELRRRWLTAQ